MDNTFIQYLNFLSDSQRKIISKDKILKRIRRDTNEVCFDFCIDKDFDKVNLQESCLKECIVKANFTFCNVDQLNNSFQV